MKEICLYTCDHRFYFVLPNDKGTYDMFIHEPDGTEIPCYHRNMNLENAKKLATGYTNIECEVARAKV